MRKKKALLEKKNSESKTNGRNMAIAARTFNSSPQTQTQPLSVPNIFTPERK
jgi:hypothetical protein